MQNFLQNAQKSGIIYIANCLILLFRFAAFCIGNKQIKHSSFEFADVRVVYMARMYECM